MDRCVELYGRYGAYHRNRTNKLIHMVCVPLILLSLFILFEIAPDFLRSPTPLAAGVRPNLGWMLWIWQVYVALRGDKLAGGLVAVAYAAFVGIAVAARQAWEPHVLLAGGLGLNALAWAGQFVGHAVFEKRRPALVDDLHLINHAPLFIALEFIFAAGGKKKLQQRCDQVADALAEDARQGKDGCARKRQ
eukprot:GHVT01100661.1.p1 GENE.GHVT01100661.1~~GHVT01100661.1.p1  ORF type:complete len:191 (-),score=43.07 GHVT01100661.1:421-993(-)